MEILIFFLIGWIFFLTIMLYVTRKYLIRLQAHTLTTTRSMNEHVEKNIEWKAHVNSFLHKH